MKPHYHFLFALALLVLGGCEPQSDDPAVNAMAELDVVHFASATPGRSIEGRRASLSATSEAMSALERALEGVPLDAPDRADAAIQQALSALDGEALGKAEQVAGVVMVETFLEKSPDTPQTRQIAARYTQRLVDLGSPEAETILDGFAEVGEVWDDATRRANAATAVASAERFLALQGGPPASESARRVRSFGGTSAEQIASALDRLQRLTTG